MVDEVTGASSAVTTFPWALVLVVVGLALGWWWRRRAHRRRIARAVDAALARVGAPDADGDAPVSPASRSGTTSDGCTRDTASSGRPVAPGSTRSR